MTDNKIGSSFPTVLQIIAKDKLETEKGDRWEWDWKRGKGVADHQIENDWRIYKIREEELRVLMFTIYKDLSSLPGYDKTLRAENC